MTVVCIIKHYFFVCLFICLFLQTNNSGSFLFLVWIYTFNIRLGFEEVRGVNASEKFYVLYVEFYPQTFKHNYAIYNYALDVGEILHTYINYISLKKTSHNTS